MNHVLHKAGYCLKWLGLWLTRPLRRVYVANECCHTTLLEGEVVSLGQRYITTLSITKNGNPDHCLACLGEMSIRCMWCGGPIHIDDPITLYMMPEDMHHCAPERGMRYPENPECVVGCLRWNCAGWGGDRQGFWVTPGRVHRVPSVLEQMLMAGNEGKAIIINDLSDPNDHGTLIDM